MEAATLQARKEGQAALDAAAFDFKIAREEAELEYGGALKEREVAFQTQLDERNHAVHEVRHSHDKPRRARGTS